jgi:hypothetical protein
MKMCGDSHYPNWFGSYSRLTVGSLVTVNEPLKVRIGFYATLNAKILEGFPGTVWIKVFVTLLDESYNQIDYKRLLFKETDWTGSVDFTGYKHKLDSETTLQPNHNYYLCVKWEGYLQCTGYVHATDGTGYADLIISQILWSFY